MGQGGNIDQYGIVGQGGNVGKGGHVGIWCIEERLGAEILWYME